MKKVLVIGESLPLPTDELAYEDTWVYRLAFEVPDVWVIDKCVRSRSVTTLMHGGPNGQAKNLYEWYCPDCIIIHLGLTDCAPRLLPDRKMFTKIVKRIPYLSTFVFNWCRKHKGRRIEYANITPKEFFENLDGYCKRVFPHMVGIVKISLVTEATLQKSPQFNKSIRLYNSIIDNVCSENENAIAIQGLTAESVEDYQTDGMHLTASGQDKILSEIKKILSTVYPPVKNS